MNLKEFITETIVGIAEAVGDAAKRLDETTAIVNPSLQSTTGVTGTCGSVEIQGTLRPVHLIEFDVAVHAAKGKSTEGGIGIVVASIGLGTKGKSQSSDSSESRIKFSVPVALPYREV